MVRSIAFDIDNYGSTDRLMQDVIKVLQVLTNNDYACTFRYEDAGIYVLEFASNNPELAEPHPYWLTEEEYDRYLDAKKLYDDLMDDEEESSCGDCCNDNKIYG